MGGHNCYKGKAARYVDNSMLVKNLTGIFLLLMFLSGCVITAASGTRTEYEDKMKKIEKDYKEMKITKDEYIALKYQVSHKEGIGQEGNVSKN